jgi:peptidoglycan hydrolase CwlO-like protein
MVDEMSRAFERHAQTALVMLIVALLLWVGKTTQDTSVTIAQLHIHIENLQKQTAPTNQKFREIEIRLDSIEKQLQSIRDKQENNDGKR